jgi:polyisoprenoid-binding protein YceI
MRSSLVILLSMGLGQGAANAEARQYTLDPKASQIVIHVGKSGLFRFAGHEHDVVVGSFRGKAVVDPEQIERSSVEITIDAASLRITGKGRPAQDVSEVQANMTGPKCLDLGG